MESYQNEYGRISMEVCPLLNEYYTLKLSLSKNTAHIGSDVTESIVQY